MRNTCSTPDCENERRPNQHYCRDCHAAYMREQRAQGKNKRIITDEDRIKNQARRKANYAVEKGEIEKATECEHCGATGRLEKHHHDYSKPLEITWLCTRCHGKVHADDDELVEAS